jgi:putative DNA methylase
MTIEHPVVSPKKLIEVALPLDAINEACKQDKNPFLKSHPRAIHLWWARRPFAAARAVLFAQLVHDPEDLWRCQNPGKEPNSQVKGHWTKARARLCGIIEELVLWENTTNDAILDKAREEIRRSWRETCELNKNHPQAKKLFDPNKMPGIHDPFAGGGAIPLEAQRLGLETYASDLNPVAVLINKAMIELPPNFAGQSPVNPKSRNERPLIKATWHGAHGLANDVRYYGKLMRDKVFTRIGHLYPPVEITKAMVRERSDLQPYLGEKLSVVAWLWARTVKSPNPAFSHIDVPLASTFILSNKAGKEAYVEPVVEDGNFRFAVRIGKAPVEAKAGTKIGRGGNFQCLVSGSPISVQSIREAGQAGQLGERLMAIVAEGSRGKVFLSPSEHQEQVARSALPEWRPDLKIAENPRDIRCQLYGLMTYADLFTPRQLLALTGLSDLIGEALSVIRADAVAAGLLDDDRSLANGGTGARAYSEAISVYLSCGISQLTRYSSTLCSWNRTNTNVVQVFGRQALPMVWDFAEANPFVGALSYEVAVGWVADALEELPAFPKGECEQRDAATVEISETRWICTDPPYYDNIAYADLSDFFYVWLRRSLRTVLPELFATIAVPKAEELVATPYRHASKEKAEEFFLSGMSKVMRTLADRSHPAAPLIIYYAFKQSETESEGTNSTGWETFLESVNRAGLALTGTWPMRTEKVDALKKTVNALASSIILVCRPRSKDAVQISRRQFIRELNAELPVALDAMTRESEGLHSPVAPVDLSQAIIGPGMAVFSKYAAVLEADGTPMSIHTAMQLINRFLAEDDFDADTQFCLHWFDQYGWETGKFGEADTLARAKGTSVDGVKQAGVLHAAGGNVRLLKWAEYPSDWDPQSDQRLPIWEVLHQLIRVFNTDGETGAAAVFAAVQSKAEAARQLAYRLYTLCERKNWAEDARAYNEVVTSWSGIESAAAKESTATQPMLFDN